MILNRYDTDLEAWRFCRFIHDTDAGHDRAIVDELDPGRYQAVHQFKLLGEFQIPEGGLSGEAAAVLAESAEAYLWPRSENVAWDQLPDAA